VRIALLSANYAPEPTGIGPYSAELAEALVERGHEVRVVATFPYYPVWRQARPPGVRLWAKEVLNGIGLLRLATFVPRRPTTGLRLLHEISWVVVSLAPAASLGRWADVLLVVSPAFGSALIGAVLARLAVVPAHLHVQDLIPDVAAESGQLESPWLRRFSTAIARWVYRSYKSLSVLSETMAVRLRSYVGDGPRVTIAPNWVRYPANATAAQMPREIRGMPYVVYAGSAGRKQDLDLLRAAARQLEAQGGPRIVVMGGGPQGSEIASPTRHVVNLGLVDDDMYRAVVKHALAGVVALKAGVGDSVVPSKLAGYMGAGLPVIAAVREASEAARVVKDAGCGFVVPPGDIGPFVRAALSLMADGGLRQRMGEMAAGYAARHWSRDAVMATLANALGDVATMCGGRSSA
jgi:colanic acid biosynthesis glycosyl transferase WcaI